MNLFRVFFDLFFPPRCIYCNDFLAVGDRPLICRKCEDLLPKIEVRCSKCGGVFTYNNGKPECLTCKAAGRYFDGVFSASSYRGDTRKAILKYKFSSQVYMAKPLAHFTIDGLKKLAVKTDIVLSVPPDPGRQTKRGFDATGELAKVIAKSLKLPYKSNIIRKIKSTPAQSTLTRAQRLKNLKGAFAVSSRADLNGLSVLLIDDVFTTGATTSEITKLLKKKGAKYVFVATLSR